MDDRRSGYRVDPADLRLALRGEASLTPNIDPLTWADLNDRDVVQAVFHSHISSPPRPSRTDVQNIGLWAGQPYLIYTLRTDELAAWRIVDGAIEAVPLR